MEIIFEIAIQILIELFGQIFFEFLAEFGIRGIGHATGIQKPKSPILACFGYVLLAGIASAISLLIFPDHYIRSYEARILNLVATPVAVGFLMSLRGKLLEKKGKSPIRLDSFAYGYLFALVFGLIRFWFGNS